MAHITIVWVLCNPKPFRHRQTHFIIYEYMHLWTTEHRRTSGALRGRSAPAPKPRGRPKKAAAKPEAPVVRLSVPSRLSIDIAKPLLPQAPGCFLFSSSTQNLFRCFYTVCGTRESCSMSYVQYDETFALQDNSANEGKPATPLRNRLPSNVVMFVTSLAPIKPSSLHNGLPSLSQELLKWAWDVHARVTGELPPFSLELPAEGGTAVAVPGPPDKRQRKN